MAGRKQSQSEETQAGAPEWMVTFSDCMTLLLTFFVLMLSFATFEKETLPVLGQSFAKALPSMGLSNASNKESFWEKQQSQESIEKTEGTETKTTERENKKNFMGEKKPLDFRNFKVFSVPSNDFFWGNGYAISDSGKQVLDALAKFLQASIGRVVISENGPDGQIELGLERSMAVLEYLTEKGLPADRFSITASTTTRGRPGRRQLEVTLLERSIYE